MKYKPDQPEVRLIPIDINNIGLCLNLGVKIARGKYYIQLDSDDRLKKDAVEKILKVFDEDPKIGIVIGSYEVWEMKKKSKKLSRVESIPVVTHDEWTEDNGRNNLLRINGAGAPRAIPINIIKKIGYFGVNDEPFARNYGEDYEMVLKISEKYRVGRIWDPIYEVVRHDGGTDHSINMETITRNDEAKDFMRYEAMNRRKIMNGKNGSN
jgi:glycosyltransferase involved in cell wall biosynthesis